MHITVTKPYLPNKAKYLEYVEDIWERNWITNGGPLVNQLELEIKKYLGLEHLVYTSNGTVALQIAIKAAQLSGEVITTPFSYVATTSSIVWEGLTPVFVDIDPETFNIDPSKIEQKITSRTSGILATHVFGNPCDIQAIEKIAKSHNLKVIYDAAHCFGVRYQGRSVFDYGDLSTASFHGTKLFHTIEGGAIVTKNKELVKTLVLMRNFGHDGFDKFSEIGINGKNSEFHAAMGLTMIGEFEQILDRRKLQFLRYQELLATHNSSNQKITKNCEYNFSYFPIVFNSESELLESLKTLNDNHIFPRRYFYPSLNQLPYVKSSSCKIAESVASRILCLPLYHELTHEEQQMISRLLLRVQNS